MALRPADGAAQLRCQRVPLLVLGRWKGTLLTQPSPPVQAPVQLQAPLLLLVWRCLLLLLQ